MADSRIKLSSLMVNNSEDRSSTGRFRLGLRYLAPLFQQHQQQQMLTQNNSPSIEEWMKFQ
ncbi:hypothetical protein CR513_27667, partial [Mucuna pruriens]